MVHPKCVIFQSFNPKYPNDMPSRLKRHQDQGHYHFRQRHQFFVFGYVLMPEHVHLLLTEPKLQPLATTLSVLKRETSKLAQSEIVGGPGAPHLASEMWACSHQRSGLLVSE